MDQGGNDAEQDHHTHLERPTAKLAANRAIMLGQEAQVAEGGERKIQAYDQGIKDLEDERDKILDKEAGLRELRRRIEPMWIPQS